MLNIEPGWYARFTYRVGQNRVSAPYMIVCMVIPPLKIPCVHRIYLLMYGSGQPYSHNFRVLALMNE